MDLQEPEDGLDTNENVINIYENSMLQYPSNVHHFNTNMHSIQSSKFQSLVTGRLNSQSLSPAPIAAIQMDRNPFNTMNVGIIPGPITLRCDNIQFIKSWIKYIFQSTISVASHTLSFLITILWIRFLFCSYYDYEYNYYNDKNDTSSYTLSILSYLPSSSWIWISICLTNIVFFLGFMIQTWIIPIQWNFEDNSNTKLFRYFGIIFILIVIISNITFNVLQILSYSIFYNILIMSQIIIVMLFSFILLFVIIKNGRNSNCLTSTTNKQNDNNNNNTDIDIDLSSEPSSSPIKNTDNNNNKNENNEIYKKIEKKSRKNIIAAFSNNYSCSKLTLICTLFSLIITSTIASLYINFHFVLSFILNNNNNNKQFFDRNFMIHLSITIFGTLLIGDLLILFMRILMRWLTILLSDSYNGNSRHSISWSFNAHYGSMQSFNRMILFPIPLIFIIKLSVFVMLYTFIDAFEFAVAVTIFCIFSRCFNQIFMMIENKMIQKLMNEDDSDYYEDESTMTNLQDHHLLAQCNYIHDIIHYIATLLIPLMFGLFGVNLQNKHHSSLPQYHYFQTAAIQFVIQSIFDLFPLLIILCGNPVSTSQSRPYGSFYHLSQNLPIINDEASHFKSCCQISGLAMNLKVQYINMMNGWTATDKCVRHFMWWSTIFCGGYFAFYLLYPQQFLCAIKYNRNNWIFHDWIYIQCQ